MGVARAPVVGSGCAPAWPARVENPGRRSVILFSLRLPHPEERPLGRVSKDEQNGVTSWFGDGAPDSASALPGARLLTMRGQSRRRRPPSRRRDASSMVRNERASRARVLRTIVSRFALGGVALVFRG